MTHTQTHSVWQSVSWDNWRGDLGMGVKSLRCFPWYGRRKERKRSKSSHEETPASPAPQEEKPRLRSTNSSGSDTDGQQSRACFSGKARVSFRHEMDSMFVNDSTF
ncbi:uncharacterized protein C17orf114 homolog [Ranitomeya variabilis]|uniref:uncharacterized protein C17orf114 homolog n=1 Tax=Ranitomeya variabilis TaxID=490064 RepID=UPI0040567411